jgi:hypothetical protein
MPASTSPAFHINQSSIARDCKVFALHEGFDGDFVRDERGVAGKGEDPRVFHAGVLVVDALLFLDQCDDGLAAEDTEGGDGDHVVGGDRLEEVHVPGRQLFSSRAISSFFEIGMRFVCHLITLDVQMIKKARACE